MTPGVYKRQKDEEEERGSRKVTGAQCDVMCPFELLVTSMAVCPHPHPRGLVASAKSLMSCNSLFFYSVWLIVIRVLVV